MRAIFSTRRSAAALPAGAIKLAATLAPRTPPNVSGLAKLSSGFLLAETCGNLACSRRQAAAELAIDIDDGAGRSGVVGDVI